MKKELCIIMFILLCLTLRYDKPLFTKFYYQIESIKHPNSIQVLVNKNHQLSSHYVPKDLEVISNQYAYDEKYLRKEARLSFERLSEEASTLGYRIIGVSAYRDYDYQKKLYQYYVDTKGKEYADLCSARPGHSEHQSGLAIDVMGSNLDYNLFEESEEFTWMSENAHHYGFILRYPKGKEHITGFKYEPWHYRYVGVELATTLYQKNLTLEEYFH